MWQCGTARLASKDGKAGEAGTQPVWFWGLEYMSPRGMRIGEVLGERVATTLRGMADGLA